MKLIVGLWLMTIVLLVATYKAVGTIGPVIGSLAGVALGLSACITCVKFGGKS